MDSIVLEGVTYVKAAVAAKQFDYTSDYVGQLCRGKKIRARLVGRSWYVDPESLSEYKNGVEDSDTDEKDELKSTTHQNKSSLRNDDSAIKIKIHRVDVPKSISSKTVTSLHSMKQRRSFDSPQSKTQYSDDEQSLLPVVKEKPEASSPKTRVKAKVVRVQSSGKKVPIASQTKNAKFSTTKLPSVSLSGKVKVFDVSEDEIMADDSRDDHPLIKPSKSHSKQDSEPVRKKRRPVKKQEAIGKIKPLADGSDSSSVPSFTPKFAQQPARLSVWLRFSPLIATIFALVCVGLVFSASSMVTSEASQVNSTIAFQLQNMLDAFTR